MYIIRYVAVEITPGDERTGVKKRDRRGIGSLMARTKIRG